jgi:GDPmannose 4,6-dehydratase
VAKASAYWLVNNYREAYGLYACTGILFNHESPLRPHRFVTQKIVQASKRIAAGSQEKLTLGRMNISRDWGWAPDYVEAMWLMLQQQSPEDFVIATGHTFSLQEFVAVAFELQHLDWRDHVVQDAKLFRPSDILRNSADPSKAKKQLNWAATLQGTAVVQAMANN